MQPIQTSVSIPGTTSLARNTHQNLPESIKELRSTGSELHKITDKPSNEAGGNSSLASVQGMDLLFLSLINQFIEQIQGLDTEDYVTETNADSSESAPDVSVVTDTETEISAGDTLQKTSDEVTIGSTLEEESQSINAASSEIDKADKQSDELRRLEELNVTLIGFSGPGEDQNQDIFKVKMFEEGRFSNVIDSSAGLS